MARTINLQSLLLSLQCLGIDQDFSRLYPVDDQILQPHSNDELLLSLYKQKDGDLGLLLDQIGQGPAESKERAITSISLSSLKLCSTDAAIYEQLSILQTLIGDYPRSESRVYTKSLQRDCFVISSCLIKNQLFFAFFVPIQMRLFAVMERNWPLLSFHESSL